MPLSDMPPYERLIKEIEALPAFIEAEWKTSGGPGRLATALERLHKEIQKLTALGHLLQVEATYLKAKLRAYEAELAERLSRN